MFPAKHTIVRLVGAVAVAAALVALAAPAGFGAHDPWYGYAASFTRQATALASSGHDPWYGYAVSLTQQQASVPFITDTLAPRGQRPPVQGYRFITDTLAPGGGTTEVQAPAANSFDWGDAGIGAGVMASIALALLGSLRALHRRGTLAARAS